MNRQNHPSMYHTLSIWLEIEFTNNIFFWKHPFALIDHKLFLIKNKIHGVITKSLRNFFWKRVFSFQAFGIFVCLKTWFLDLQQVKVSCYRSYLMLYSNKEHYWTISANCCVNNLEMIQNVFFTSGEKNKTFCGKKF